MKLTAFLALPLLAAVNAQPPALDPNAAGPAGRIWCADMQEEQQVWFRRRFTLPKEVTTARLVFTCDNEAIAFVNGNEVARSTDWQEVAVVDLDKLGVDNVVAIEANNTGGPGSLACWILWSDAAGERHELVSDAQWRVAIDPADNWQSKTFDDTKWEQATADYTSTFGLNLYNGNPVRVRFHSRFAAAADAIETTLVALRSARDAASALQALEAMQRAVMAAQRQVAAELAKPAPAPKDTSGR